MRAPDLVEQVGTPQAEDPADSSIGELFHRLVDDGRALVGAEISLYKQIALYRAGKARNGAAALLAALFLLNAALVACFVGFVLGLAELIGPVAGGLVVLVATGIVGFLLVRYGLAKLAALGGDTEEKAALAAGEQRQ